LRLKDSLGSFELEPQHLADAIGHQFLGTSFTDNNVRFMLCFRSLGRIKVLTIPFRLNQGN
jgi:hypothetical protein